MKKRLNKIAAFLSLSFVAIPVFAQAQEASVPSVREQEEAVQDYFEDVPAMIEIAECESGMRQYTSSGSVLYGGSGGKMVGVFQLHSDYHTSPARAMGIDIETLDGNLEYARYLYETQGLQPWTPCLHAVSDSNLASAQDSDREPESGLGGSATDESEDEISREATIAELLAVVRELQETIQLLQIQVLQKQLAEI